MRRRKRLFSRVAASLVAAVIGATGVAVRPAQAVDPVTVAAWVETAASVASMFGGGGDKTAAAIEAAKREILAAIAASEKRILDHMDDLAAAEVEGCTLDSSQDLRNIDNLSRPTGIERAAADAAHCANLANRLFDAVQNARTRNLLGFLIAENYSIAMLFHAKAGLNYQFLLETFIAADENVAAKLRPYCYEGWSRDDPGLYEAYCNGADGTYARSVRRFHNGQWLSPPINVEALRDFAGRNTSYKVAKDSLPTLRATVPKLKRGFIHHAVNAGKVMQWNTLGPHFWDVVGNPGTATAVASTIDANNRRHIVAVIDGEVRHRIRDQNGIFTPWTTPGALGYSGTATAVTAAAETNGHVFVLAIFSGQVMYRFWVGEGTWTSWQWLGNPGPATAVATAADTSGLLHAAVVIGGEVRYWHNRTDGSWAPWTAPGTLGHPGTATAVTAVATQNRQLQVAAVIDGNVQHRVLMADASWSPWIDLDNPGTATAVAGGVDPNGDVQFVTVDEEEVHQRTRYQDGHWSGPLREGLDPWIKVEAVPFESFGAKAITSS